MQKYVVLYGLLLMLSACSVQKDMQAIGGSKADGTVQLSVQAPALAPAIIDENQALSVALKRCKAWGYKNVEAFGGQRQTTQQGLVTTTKNYQCLDN